MNMLNESGEYQLNLSTNNTARQLSPEDQEPRSLKAPSRRFRQQRTTTKQKEPAAACGPAKVLSKSPSIKFSANNFVTQRYDSFGKHYEIIELLGEGAYGEVYVCQHKESGAQRAVKILQVDSEEDAQVVLAEFNILRGIDHPNLLKIYQLYEDEHTGKFYIVSDLYRGGELYDELEQWGYFDEDDAAVLLNQVLGCINYCHNNGIAHRDLKPENILLADTDINFEDIKIIDFGLAEVFDDKYEARFSDKVGSSYYIAPEVLCGEHGPKVDIWACGVILFILLCGEAPFDGDDDMEIMEAIYEGTYTFDDNELWDDISDEAKDFVEMLLTYDEDLRPTAEEALAHPWLEQTRRTSALGVQKRASKGGAINYLANLEHFRADSKLKQAVCAFISSQLIMKHEKDVMDELFRAMDTACDGRLSKEELKVGYKDFLGRELTDQEVDDIFERVNFSCSGAIEYSEFLVASITLDESRLQATFKEFDKSGAGVLTASDLLDVLDLGDSRDAEDYVDKILAQIDTDHHDGSISFEDFRNAMIPEPVQTNKRASRRLSRRISEKSNSSGSRRSIRRSTQINLEEIEDALAAVEQKKKDGRSSSMSSRSSSKVITTTANPAKVTSNDMDGLLKSWHEARTAKKAPKKLRTARSLALPHAISTSYARRPSRVQSRVQVAVKR